MKARFPLCSAFQVRWEGSATCGWCMHDITEHEFLDATVWSTAGPFIEAGRSDSERVPNPKYRRPEVAA